MFKSVVPNYFISCVDVMHQECPGGYRQADWRSLYCFPVPPPSASPPQHQSMNRQQFIEGGAAVTAPQAHSRQEESNVFRIAYPPRRRGRCSSFLPRGRAIQCAGSGPVARLPYIVFSISRVDPACGRRSSGDCARFCRDSASLKFPRRAATSTGSTTWRGRYWRSQMRGI